jgi:hypothetical protein
MKHCDCSVSKIEIKLDNIHEDIKELKALEPRVEELERGFAVGKWIGIVISTIGAFIANNKLNIF